MAENFEELYRREAEPWSYSNRAAEALRHETVAELAAQLLGRGLHNRITRVLDVGCSVGQLTGRLDGVASEVHGIDISPTAAAKARSNCASLHASTFLFAAGTSTAPPYRAGCFDLALLCDGLHSWRLTAEQQDETLRQLHGLTRPGGHVILTDYLKTHHFDPFIQRVRQSPLQIVEVRYLNDRLWYTVERLARPVRNRMSVKRALASRRLGRGLAALSGLVGRRGSKHILIIARRPS